MKAIFIALSLFSSAVLAAEPKIVLEETFTSELSKDWFWGLGTWKAEKGVLQVLNPVRVVMGR